MAAALLVLVAVAWVGVYVTLQQSAVDVLAAEAEEVRTELTIRSDTVLATGHTWSEPHHRLPVRRVDPIFVQVFDADGHLLRASANIDSLAAGYPSSRLDRADPGGLWTPLRTLTVGDRPLYYLSIPVTQDGKDVAYVQVSRDMPQNASLLRSFALGLFAIWALLSGGLVLLLSWAATRVLRPLQAITEQAESIRSSDLEERIDVPADADRETAVLTQTVNDLLDRMEEHVEALQAFTSNAAHELQTPLTVLRGHVEIALRRERSGESYRETLRFLDDKLSTLVQTVRALLTLTRLEHGAELEREAVDLGPLVADEVDTYRDMAEAKGLSLTVDVDSAPLVLAHPGLLREAVRNLAENAIRYTPEGAVEITSGVTNGHVDLTVRDTGVGIDDEEMEQIAGRFFRGRSAGAVSSEGSGLGLSMTTRIAECLDGSLHVAARDDGRGTTFVLRLPVAPQDRQ